MSKVGPQKLAARPELPENPVPLLRQFGTASAAALVVSNMVGTGIFATTGYLAGDLGSVGIILLIWLVGAICALAGAFCYSELGINFPSSGGEYVYLTRAFGPTWGFMVGWVSFFAGFSAPIAAAALAFSDYLGYFFPMLKQENAHFTLGPDNFSLTLGGAQVAAWTVHSHQFLRRQAGCQAAKRPHPHESPGPDGVHRSGVPGRQRKLGAFFAARRPDLHHTAVRPVRHQPVLCLREL
jgi:hypothetical protein